jgi:hypothetical protein
MILGCGYSAFAAANPVPHERQPFVTQSETRLKTVERELSTLKEKTSGKTSKTLEDLSVDAKDIRADLSLAEERSSESWGMTQKKIELKLSELENAIQRIKGAPPSTLKE